MALMRMYTDLADWWHLLSPPGDYEDEAGRFATIMRRAARRPVRRVLELGSGGGNNASHLRAWFDMTLVDLSPQMIAVSRRINPGVEHVEGDMRRIRLGRTFDAVFVHDAIDYMRTRRDLASTFATAFAHLEPGGSAVFAPDWTRETFTPGEACGGEDGRNRSIRWLMWTHPAPARATTYSSTFVYALRSGRGPVRIEHEQHTGGLFPRATWLGLMRRAGFRARRVTVPSDFMAPSGTDVFVGVRPPSARG